MNSYVPHMNVNNWLLRLLTCEPPGCTSSAINCALDMLQESMKPMFSAISRRIMYSIRLASQSEWYRRCFWLICSRVFAPLKTTSVDGLRSRRRATAAMIDTHSLRENPLRLVGEMGPKWDYNHRICITDNAVNFVRYVMDFFHCGPFVPPYRVRMETKHHTDVEDLV